jgi:adenine-specific DNA methylase
MENFEEKLKAKTEVFKAKIASLIAEVDKAVIESAETAQKFKAFAEEVHAEKIAKLQALLEQERAKAEV